MRFLVLCFLLASVVSCALAESRRAADGSGRHVRWAQTVCADPRREYLDCGPACPAHCEDEGGCTAQCLSGCFCKQGLLLDAFGECVTPDMC